MMLSIRLGNQPQTCQGVSIFRWFHKGVPKSWMLFVRENPTNMDENWGYTYDLGTPNFSVISISKTWQTPSQYLDTAWLVLGASSYKWISGY